MSIVLVPLRVLHQLRAKIKVDKKLIGTEQASRGNSIDPGRPLLIGIVTGRDGNILGAFRPVEILFLHLTRLDDQALRIRNTGIKAVAFEKFVQAILLINNLVEGIRVFQLIEAKHERMGGSLVQIQTGISGEVHMDRFFFVTNLRRLASSASANHDGDDEKRQQRKTSFQGILLIRRGMMG